MNVSLSEEGGQNLNEVLLQEQNWHQEVTLHQHFNDVFFKGSELRLVKLLLTKHYSTKYRL
jgi:hypothetical protein